MIRLIIFLKVRIKGLHNFSEFKAKIIPETNMASKRAAGIIYPLSFHLTMYLTFFLLSFIHRSNSEHVGNFFGTAHEEGIGEIIK